MNDTESTADATPLLPIEPRLQKATQSGPASAADWKDHNLGLDLNRIGWDAENRREVVERLISRASDPGGVDRPG